MLVVGGGAAGGADDDAGSVGVLQSSTKIPTKTKGPSWGSCHIHEKKLLSFSEFCMFRGQVLERQTYSQGKWIWSLSAESHPNVVVSISTRVCFYMFIWSWRRIVDVKP